MTNFRRRARPPCRGCRSARRTRGPRSAGATWSAAAAILAAGLAIGARPAEAQGYRAEVRVGGSFLGVRTLVRDSLPEGQVPGDGLRRRLDDGTVMACTPGEFCRWFAAGEVESVSVLTQELRAVGWTGIQGLSAHVHLRGRYGTDDFWPRADQELEALSAYVNYDAGDYRVRAGRQYRTDGLGYYNFDGLAAVWRGFDPLRIEAYGGWALAPGLAAPRSGDLLEEADEFAPDDRGFILGAEVGVHRGRRVSASVGYQREIRTDLDALYSERLALDARAMVGPVTVDAASEYDLSFEEFNEASLRLSGTVGPGVRLSAEARHHVPFFELWTIWGAFSPVGFDEANASASWSVPGTGISLAAGGAYRVYEETDAGADFVPLEDDGWRVFGNASWARDGWFASGGYRAEVGFGAARLGGDARLGYAFSSGSYVALRGTSTQNIAELRLGERFVSGGGLEAGLEVGELTVTASAGVYRLHFENRPSQPDWTQGRGHVGISYAFGSGAGGAEGGGR